MKILKIKRIIFNIAWIAISFCVTVFFVIALCVYTQVEPSGVSELLPRDDTWHGINELCVMSGDLEVYPYVTKVYDFATDKDSVNICWVNDENVWREKVDYGIVTGASADYNYYVECFVYSNIADKQLIKRTWGVSVIEGDVLTLVESKSPYCNQLNQDIGDIKKDSYNKDSNYILLYRTFIRITAKPNCDKVGVEVKFKA